MTASDDLIERTHKAGKWTDRNTGIRVGMANQIGYFALLPSLIKSEISKWTKIRKILMFYHKKTWRIRSIEGWKNEHDGKEAENSSTTSTLKN